MSWLSVPVDELKRIWRMLRNKKTPLAPKVVTALALLYIIWPLDLLPGFAAPFFGLADDFLVGGFTLWWLHKEVERLSK